jgi:hypothetical protein
MVVACILIKIRSEIFIARFLSSGLSEVNESFIALNLYLKFPERIQALCKKLLEALA